MRIDYLSFSELPSRTANSIHVMKMGRALASAGHQVRLHGRGDPKVDEFAFYGLPQTFKTVKWPCPPFRGGGIVMSLHVGRDIRKHPLPDLFYGRHLASLLQVIGLGRPIIYEAHVPPSNWVFARAEARLFRSPYFVRLVVISDALRCEYLRRFPWLPGVRVITAHDGADLPTPACSRAKLSWPSRPDVLQCGYVGHMYEGRGIDFLIELARHLPKIDFHLVGGTEHDLAKWSAGSNPTNIHFHGFIRPAELDQVFSHFDVALAPYQSGIIRGAGRSTDISHWMSPLKIFEYMSHSKAIICSDISVIREVLEHKATALLVPPSDVDAWVSAIQDLSNNPNLRMKLGEAARNALEDRFTWEIRAKRVLAGLDGAARTRWS